MSICLIMIVKNEAARIERCLQSVKPFISNYAIVDTGSTDETPDLIPKILDPVQGVVARRAWEGFSVNRNQAIQLAEEYYGKDCEWLLAIDADEVLSVPDGFQFNLDLSIGSYLGLLRMGNTEYRRRTIVRNDGNWRYVRRVHEVLVPFKREAKEATLDGPVWIDHCDSSRRQDPVRFLRDAVALEEDWKEFGESRTAFYLAQSYRDAGWKQKAIEWYDKRASMGQWEEEVYYSLYMAASLRYSLDGNIMNCIGNFLNAYQYRPSRLESLWVLCRELRMRKEWGLVKLFAGSAQNVPPSKDILFVEMDCHWLIMEEMALAYFYTGDFQAAMERFQAIKKTWQLDGDSRKRLETNIQLCQDRLIGSFSMPTKEQMRLSGPIMDINIPVKSSEITVKF